MTFFDFSGLPKGTKGTNTISRTSFRVKDDVLWITGYHALMNMQLIMEKFKNVLAKVFRIRRF